MAKKRKLKLKEAPIYPSDYQARQYAKQQQADIDGGGNPRTAYQTFAFSDTITAVATWGLKGIYFVVAYPSDGVTVYSPEGLADIQLVEGWIFKFIPASTAFNLLVKASRDGEAFFKSERTRYKKS